MSSRLATLCHFPHLLRRSLCVAIVALPPCPHLFPCCCCVCCAGLNVPWEDAVVLFDEAHNLVCVFCCTCRHLLDVLGCMALPVCFS
jgi:hypothetical protein